MKNFNRWLIALSAALLVPALASAAVDMFLQIKDAKGQKRVVVCPGGACVVSDLPPGVCSVLVCDAQGTVIPTSITLLCSVVSPRDVATGQSSGKRQHKPLNLTMEYGRSAVPPKSPTNTIAIDEPGVHLAIGVSGEAVDAAVAKISKSRSNIQNN